MADLTASAVTISDHWVEKNLGGRKTKARRVALILTGQGDAGSNRIQASLFNMRRVDDVSPLVRYDDGLIVAAAPSADGTLVLLKNASSNAVATYSGTFHAVVKGK